MSENRIKEVLEELRKDELRCYECGNVNEVHVLQAVIDEAEKLKTGKHSNDSLTTCVGVCHVCGVCTSCHKDEVLDELISKVKEAL